MENIEEKEKFSERKIVESDETTGQTEKDDPTKDTTEEADTIDAEKKVLITPEADLIDENPEATDLSKESKQAVEDQPESAKKIIEDPISSNTETVAEESSETPAEPIETKPPINAENQDQIIPEADLIEENSEDADLPKESAPAVEDQPESTKKIIEDPISTPTETVAEKSSETPAKPVEAKPINTENQDQITPETGLIEENSEAADLPKESAPAVEDQPESTKKIIEDPISPATETVAEKSSETPAASADEESAGEVDGSEEEDGQEDEEQQLDYSNYTIKQMVQVLESLLKEDNLAQVGRILKEIKKPFDELYQTRQKEAYQRYLADGGEKDGFEYRPDEFEARFQNTFNKLKERRSQFYNSLAKQKEQNLLAKQEVLDKLRELVDSEETNASIKALKEIQDKWKSIGVIPPSQAKSLWANYNALLDRFYDQRSIYYELKELDRKKNYELKVELCEKAEQLANEPELREAIKQLNDLHEEYKHIGPVPKEDQEALWERFKEASDKIYTSRKEYYEKLKGELKLNEVAKSALVEKVLPFAEFDSEKISDWNKKTKEILEIQKEWEKIGSVPKEKAKDINKQFWTSFKSFFNRKGNFFKKIDEERKINLGLKQELLAKAEELKDSEDFRKAADELKELQKQWKEIGPVPEKQRNEVYMKFKKACDHFFNRRRNNSGKVEKEYEDNLKQKQTLCDELEKMISSEAFDLKRVKAIEAEWNEIGFVPKANIRSIQKRYTEAIGKITEDADITETEKHKMRFSAQFNTANAGPGTEKLLQKKEGALRRQINSLENDINLWKNNIDFFAASKNADKLKKDFQIKIDKAAAELQSLKDQLKVISNI